jgi:hypothetical protein
MVSESSFMTGPGNLFPLRRMLQQPLHLFGAFRRRAIGYHLFIRFKQFRQVFFPIGDQAGEAWLGGYKLRPYYLIDRVLLSDTELFYQ